MADILVGNNKKKDIAQILEEYFAVKAVKEEQQVPLVSEVIDINHTKEYEDLTIHKVNEVTLISFLDPITYAYQIILL